MRGKGGRKRVWREEKGKKKMRRGTEEIGERKSKREERGQGQGRESSTCIFSRGRRVPSYATVTN